MQHNVDKEAFALAEKLATVQKHAKKLIGTADTNAVHSATASDRMAQDRDSSFSIRVPKAFSIT